MGELYKPELIFYSGASLLEGPCWNKHKKEIVCVSILEKMIYCINPKNGEIKTYETEGQVGCIAIENERYFIEAEYGGIYRLDLNTGQKEFIVQLNQNETLRYNDGKMDVKGRFLVGTTGYNRLAQHENCLYSWDGKNKKILVEGTTISNGIDFSKDNAYMYFVDTPTKQVGRYHYDIKTGECEFDKYVIEIDDGSLPDGICTDVDDMLWVAQWGGYKVSKWNPYTGEKLMEITLPCQNVSSCCIGGADNEYLFVTTAKHDDGTKSEELAGGLFKIQIRERRNVL